MAVWIALDSVAFWLFNPVAGILFLLVALIGVYGVLKFLGCMRPCYKCKKCTFGMGRIAALFFGKRSFKDYKETYGLPTAIFFYAMLGPFPVTILFASTVQIFSVPEILILVCLLAFSFGSGLTWRSARKQ